MSYDDEVVDDGVADSGVSDSGVAQESPKEIRRSQYLQTPAGKKWLANYRDTSGLSDDEIERKFNVDLNKDGQIGSTSQGGEEGGVDAGQYIQSPQYEDPVFGNDMQQPQEQPILDFGLSDIGHASANHEDIIGFSSLATRNKPSDDIIFAAKGFTGRVNKRTTLIVGEHGAEDVIVRPVKGKQMKMTKQRAPSINNIMGFGSLKQGRGKGKKVKFRMF